jgi:serine/threonine protein kinase
MLFAFRQEVAIMWLLRDSPYTAKLLAYSEYPCVIVMPHYDLGSMLALIESNAIISKNMVLGLIFDVARGLLCMHELMVAHLDIKPANVLIDVSSTGRYSAALTDFGISKVLSGHELAVKNFVMSKLFGRSFLYAAPEVLENRIENSIGYLAVDVLSIRSRV